MDTSLDPFVLDQAPILGINLNQKIIYWNSGDEKIYGWSQSESLGKDANQLLKTVFPQPVEEIEHLLLEKGEWEGELIQTKRDETHITVKSRWVLQRDAQNQIQAYFQFNHDITQYKWKNDNLPESENQLHEILDNLEVGYFYIDRHGLFQHVNRAWLRMHHYSSPDEVIGHSFVITQNESNLQSAQKIVRLILNGEKFTSAEFSRRNKDGSVGYHIFSSSPVRKDGLIVGLEGFLIDITDREIAELHAAQLSQRYRELYENSGTSIVIIDEYGKFLLANKKAANSLGKSPEEVIGKSMADFLSSEVANKYLEFNRELIRSGGHREYEDTFLLPIGERTFLIMDQCIQDEQGRNIALQSSSIDITERKRVEEELKESEAKYRSLVDNSQMAIAQALPDGSLIFANDACAHLYGYANPQEMTAEVNSVAQFYANPKDREEVLRILKEKGFMEPREFTARHRNGTQFYILFEAREIKDTKGNLLCYQANQININERKQAELALRESEELYRQTISSISDAVFLTDSSGTFVFVCPNIDLTFGWSETEVLRMGNVDTLVGSSSLIPVELTGEMRNVEWNITDKFGVPHSLLVNIKPVSIGKATRLFACRDVTERKRAEREIREAYQFAQDTIDGLSAHICVLDEIGNILAVNQAWRDFADANPPIPLHYCVGMNYLEICDRAIGPNSSEAIPFATGLRAVMKGDKEQFVLEYPCNDPQHTQRWFSARVTHFAGGYPVRIVVAHENITSRKLAELSVAEYTAQLHSLSQRQTEAQEIERRDIARELHDEVGQVMTAVKTNLETIKLSPEPENLNEQLVESITIVDHALEQIRTLALNLRPSLLDDFGLEPALEWYLERIAKGSPLKINFVSDLSEYRLPPVIETTCFRVVQSAMTNVSRHSHATQVGIKLRWNPASQKLKLTIRDNGIGFDVAAALERARLGESLGLLGMQERVKLAGGQIVFNSKPGRGTEVRVDISLKPVENKK
jgi:PAS domain S-box-containing protein